jgi:hypothetical protein
MQWPFAEWGADLVLAGHDHSYERVTAARPPPTPTQSVAATRLLRKIYTKIESPRGEMPGTENSKRIVS